MYNCSSGITEFNFDFSGGISDERLYDVSNNYTIYNGFLHGGIYLKLEDIMTLGDKLLFILFVLAFIGFMVMI